MSTIDVISGVVGPHSTNISEREIFSNKNSLSDLFNKIWNCVKKLIIELGKEFANCGSGNGVLIDQETYKLSSEIDELHENNQLFEEELHCIFVNGGDIFTHGVSYFDEQAFVEFYSIILNSRPDLDPHFKGANLSDTISWLNNDLEMFIQTLDKNHKEDEINALKQCVSSLSTAVKNYNKLQEFDYSLSTEQENRQGEKIKTALSEMPIGSSSYVILGNCYRHSILYEFIRMSEDDYFFTIINTGEDDETIKSRIKKNENRMKEKYFYGLYTDKAYIVKKSKLDAAFLYFLLQGHEDDRVLKVLNDIDASLKKLNAVPCEGRVHHPQRRGNCSFKCLNRYVFGHLIDVLGKEKGTALYKKFKVLRTRAKWGKVQRIIDKLDKIQLKSLFKVNTDQKLNEHLVAMEKAYSKVLDKRKQKAKLAELQSEI